MTNNFVNGTVSDADAVDQNFSDLVNVFNSHAVHKGETALEAKTGSPGKKFQASSDIVHVVSGNTSGTSTITFPVAMANASYVVVVTNTEAGVYVFSVTAKAAASFTCRVTKGDSSAFAATTDLGFDYVVIGT